GGAGRAAPARRAAAPAGRGDPAGGSLGHRGHPAPAPLRYRALLGHAGEPEGPARRAGAAGGAPGLTLHFVDAAIRYSISQPTAPATPRFWAPFPWPGGCSSSARKR